MKILKWLDDDERKKRFKKRLIPIYRLFRNSKFNVFLKWVLFIAVLATIYFQVFNNKRIDEIQNEFLKHFTGPNISWLVVAALLMPINWILETMKWQVLIRKIEKIPFWKAFKGVFLGVSLSLFTPNRIGEYGGRILVVSPKNNWKIIVATLVSSFSQQIALYGMGLIGFIYFSYFYLEIEGLMLATIGIVAFLLISFLFIFYYNVQLVIPIISKIPYLRRFTDDMAVLKEYSNLELSQALGYAFLRYLTYTLQYWLILQFFNIKMNLLVGTAGIATIFLLQTSVPLPPIFDFAVRSEAALYVWGYFSANKIDIFASSFGLWFLNILIPACVGMIFIFTVNIVKSLGVDNFDNIK